VFAREKGLRNAMTREGGARSRCGGERWWKRGGSGLDGRSFRVRRPAERLREVDFVLEGQRLRAWMQNPQNGIAVVATGETGTNVMPTFFPPAVTTLGNVFRR